MDRKSNDKLSDQSGLPQGFFVLCRWVDKLSLITMILFVPAALIAKYVFSKSLFGYRFSLSGLAFACFWGRWLPYYMVKLNRLLGLIKNQSWSEYWVSYFPKVILFLVVVSILDLRKDIFSGLVIFWLAGGFARLYDRKCWEKSKRKRQKKEDA